MLYTNLDLGTEFYNGTISNFKRIVKGFEVINKRLNNHINSNSMAHKAQQISYEGTTVYNELNRVKGKMEGLVVGANGDGISEVKEARIDINGDYHETLDSRLEKDFNSANKRLDDLTRIKTSINFDKYNPNKEGEKDTAPILDKAIDELNQKGGGILYINSGTYAFTRRVNIYSNIRIIGNGDVVFLRKWAGGFFNIGNPEIKYEGYDGIHDVTIENIEFDGNYEEYETIKTNGFVFINLLHNKDVEFRKCKFKNSVNLHVLDVNGVDNLNIIDCVFEGFKDANGRSFKEAIQLSEFAEGGVDSVGCYDGTPTKNVNIERCIFKKSDLLGGFNVAIGNHFSRHGVTQKNIRISHCSFNDIKQTAIRTYTWHNVHVLDNEFENCNECVRATAVGHKDKSAQYPDGKPSNKPEAGKKYFIKGNVFSNYGEFALIFKGQQSEDDIAYCRDVIIQNNMFQRDNYDVGQTIDLTLCNYVIINSNNINTTHRGVSYNGSRNVTISDNFFYNIKTEAIYNAKSIYINEAKNSRNIFIKDNVFNTIGRNCLYLTGIYDYVIRDNYIVDPHSNKTDSTNRGGIYSVDSVQADISNNIIYGHQKDFAIRLSNCKNSVLTNNGGTGLVSYYDSTNTVVGHYTLDSDNYITKKSE